MKAPPKECDRCGNDSDRVLSPVKGIDVRERSAPTWRPYVVCGACWRMMKIGGPVTARGASMRKCAAVEAPRPDVRQQELFNEPA